MRAAPQGDTPPSATGASALRPQGAWRDLATKVVVFSLLFAAGTLLYLPTLSFDFLSWDDKRYIVNNPLVRELSIKNILTVFSEPYFRNYLPLHLLSYQLDFALWGPQAFSFHLHSVLLHGLNTILACLTTMRLGAPWPVAAVASLFFAVHPSHVESVAWLSSRKDLLSLTFALLATLAYCATRASGRSVVGYRLLSLACYCAAVLSKMIVVLLPIFFLLVDRLENRVSGRRVGAGLGAAILEKFPFFSVGILLATVNYQVQAKDLEAKTGGALKYLLVKGYAIWNYLLVLCGATQGRPAYDLPALGIRQQETTVAWGGLIFAVLATAAMVVAWRRRQSSIILAAGWLVLMLLPALAFPLVTFMADRYLYAASLGFLWLLAAAIFATARRIRNTSIRVLALGMMVTSGATVFGLRTVAYLPVWKNSETLWTHVVKTSDSRMAQKGLAAVRMNQGRFDEAEQLLGKGSAPHDADTSRMFGILYDKKGLYPQAIREYERAIALCQSQEQCGPELLGALHFNSGVTYWHMRDYRASARSYEQAFRVDPENREANSWATKAHQLVRGEAHRR